MGLQCFEWHIFLPPALCPILVNPANGTVEQTGRSSGDTVTYSCNENFSLVGTQIQTCGDDGMWSDSPPTCYMNGMKMKYSSTSQLLTFRTFGSRHFNWACVTAKLHDVHEPILPIHVD